MLHDKANLPTSTSRDHGRDAQPESERKRFSHPDRVPSTSHDDEVDVQIRDGLWDDKRLWLPARCRRRGRGRGGERARIGDRCSGLGTGTERGAGSQRAWGRRTGSGCWKLGRAWSGWSGGGSLWCALEVGWDSAWGLRWYRWGWLLWNRNSAREHLKAVREHPCKRARAMAGKRHSQTLTGVLVRRTWSAMRYRVGRGKSQPRVDVLPETSVRWKGRGCIYIDERPGVA